MYSLLLGQLWITTPYTRSNIVKLPVLYQLLTRDSPGDSQQALGAITLAFRYMRNVKKAASAAPSHTSLVLRLFNLGNYYRIILHYNSQQWHMNFLLYSTTLIFQGHVKNIFLALRVHRVIHSKKHFLNFCKCIRKDVFFLFRIFWSMSFYIDLQ